MRIGPWLLLTRSLTETRDTDEVNSRHAMQLSETV